MPADIAEEFLTASLRLGLAKSDIRAPISTKISCTDATPIGGGTVCLVRSLVSWLKRPLFTGSSILGKVVSSRTSSETPEPQKLFKHTDAKTALRPDV
eukprot:8744030-Heterocapsa_arctica.AAC.1